MLVNLMEQYAPSNKSRKAKLLQQYRRLQKPPSNKDAEMWLDEWLTVYHDAHALQLPNVADESATVDFPQAIKSLHLKLQTYRIKKVEDTSDSLSLEEIVTKFCSCMRQTMETEGASHGTFPFYISGSWCGYERDRE
jgi:hypothetical protein